MAEPRFRRVRVSEVVAETPDACSLVLDVPPEAAADFGYRPGQFLTLRIPAGPDGSVARCYSLASSPDTGEKPKVTVKRVAGGVGSGWICDSVTPGTVLDTLAPAGTFTPGSLDGDFLLLAAGSGITPVISIVKSVLARGSGRIVLVYANRDEESVIFAGELRRLAAEHPSRLLVLHWLESVQGTPTAAQLHAVIAPHASAEPFVCGPDAFMAAAGEALGELGVPRGRLHVERFVSLSDNPFLDAPAPADQGDGGSGTVEVELDGERHRFVWPRQTRLLDLLREKGLDAPFSCREGACSACACRIEEGEVKMLRNEVLDEEDIAEGYVLACQAIPVTDTVKVSYD